MKIAVNDSTYDFDPWRPERGRVFDSVFAFDSETTLIDDERPWITPAYVLGAACGGTRGCFIRREHLAAFFAVHRDLPVVMHNAPFDLGVIDTLAPTIDIYHWVDRDLVWDTQLLHRGYMLAAEGHTGSGRGQSTLDHCAGLYLDVALPKDLVDSRGKPVRKSYGQWLSRDPREIEPIYLEYLAKDVVVTSLLFNELRRRLKHALEQGADAFGYVSPEWLAEQVRRWGWQTHHIQLKAAIVLKAITANGLTVDLDRREELLGQLGQVADEQLADLRVHGFVPEGEGSQKALQDILRREEALNPGLCLPRTASGRYATKKQTLAELVDALPFIKSYVEFKETQKLRGTFLNRMNRRVLHPSFDVLKTSGRTSSFGEINAQNLPRDDRVRSCFVPAAGHVFIDADYSTVELATLAQAAMAQLLLPSRMAERINTGKDLHRLVAARMAGKPEEEITADERQKAKAINFGKPGGMGHASLKGYAKASYGVNLTDDEVEALSNAWFTMFPEMETYLAEDRDYLNLQVAAFFDLTPLNYYEHSGCPSFVNNPANAGRENAPHPILAAMCLKVMREPEPCAPSGPYSDQDLDYFWSRVEQKIESLPSQLHHAVRQRVPSRKLWKGIMRTVDRGKVFTLTGRLRAGASYGARHNTPFQGLAADGAKLALWKLWRAGYRIANFIHDEVLVEVPTDSDLREHAENIRALMVAGMKEVVPDVKIDVEYAASKRWYKAAKVVFDDAGRLLPWEPAEKEADEEEVSEESTIVRKPINLATAGGEVRPV